METIYKNHSLVEPENLFGFSSIYENMLPELKAYVYLKQNKHINILVKRLDSRGDLQTKNLSGVVKSIQQNGFTLSTNQGFDSVYGELHDIFIRYDNPLGVIPVMKDINPLSNLPVLSDYRQWVKETRKIITPDFVGKKIVLYFKYKKEKELFRNGNFFTAGNLLKFNRSNIEFQHLQTLAYINSDKRYAELTPHVEIDRFVAPDRFVWRIEIFDYSMSINPYNVD